MSGAQRLWIIVSLVVINASFVAGMVSWRWTEAAPEVPDSPYLKALAEFREAEEPREKYLKALNVVATLNPSMLWWEIRAGGASAGEGEKTYGADEAHVYVAEIAKRAAKFEASWTSGERARIKKESGDSFLARADILESFAIRPCGTAEYAQLREKYPLEDLQWEAYVTRILVQNEDWNGAFLVRRAIRNTLGKVARFEGDSDLGETFYDEKALAFLMTPQRLGVGARFPAKYLRSPTIEAYFLRHGVRHSDIKAVVLDLVKQAPGCWSSFTNVVSLVHDEYTRKRGRDLARELARILRTAGTLPKNLFELSVTTAPNDEKIRDGWQQPFQLVHGERPAVISSGPDLMLGTSDDIVFPLQDEGDASNAKGTGF